MKGILDKIIEKLYNRTVDSFSDSKIKIPNLLISKLFNKRGEIITVENYHLESTEKAPDNLTQKTAISELADYLAENEDEKTYILTKLQEFDNVTHDRIASVILLNLDLYVNEKLKNTTLSKLDVLLDAFIDEIWDAQGTFESPKSLKENLDKVSDYLKQLKTTDNQRYLEYLNGLNVLIASLNSSDAREIEDSSWLSINENFVSRSHNVTKFFDTENKTKQDITNIVFTNLVNNDLFDENNTEYFNNYQYVLDLIKNNFVDISNENLEDEEKDFIQNITNEQQDFISCVTTILLARELDHNETIDKSDVLGQNLRLFAKRSYEKMKDDLIQNPEYSKKMSEIMENLLKISLKTANSLYNIKFNKDLHDYKELLEAIETPKSKIIIKNIGTNTPEPIIKESNKELKPKSTKKYTTDILDKLIKILYQKDKAYLKFLSNIRKIDVNKRLSKDKLNLLTSYAEKFLSADEKEYFSMKFKDSFKITENELILDFNNKDMLAKLVDKTEKAIINEKAQYGNFVAILKKDMVKKIANDIITSGNKSTFIEKMNKLMKDNFSDPSYAEKITEIMDELYELSSTLVSPILKDSQIPYKFINPKDIKKIIVEDSMSENPKYPNLFGIIRFSKNLDEVSVKSVTNKSITEVQRSTIEVEQPSINISNKLKTILEKVNSPINSKEERDNLKKMIKNLYYEIKRDNSVWPNKQDTLDMLSKLPNILNGIKFENPKTDLIKFITSKQVSNEIINNLAIDLEQLSLSTKEYIREKYLVTLQKILSDEDLQTFNKKFDSIAIQSQNEKNKVYLKNEISDAVDEIIKNDSSITPDKEYKLYQLCTKAKTLIDLSFKVKTDNPELIANLKNTIDELFVNYPKYAQKFKKEIDKSIQDIKFAKLNLQNMYLIQDIKRTLLKFKIDINTVNKIVDQLHFVKTKQDQDDIIQEYSSIFVNNDQLNRFSEMVHELNVCEFEIINYDNENNV